MSKRLEGKVAFVTGGTSGIGFACVKRFAEEGAIVVAYDLKNLEQWSQIEAICGENQMFIEGDVTNLNAQQAAAEQVARPYKQHFRWSVYRRTVLMW